MASDSKQLPKGTVGTGGQCDGLTEAQWTAALQHARLWDDRIVLELVDLSRDMDEIWPAAGRDPTIWSTNPYLLRDSPAHAGGLWRSQQDLHNHYANRLKAGDVAFVCRERLPDSGDGAVRGGRLIGSYTLMDMSTVHRHAEIGGVWVSRDFRGSGSAAGAELRPNVRAVALLLRFCFETLRCVRVMWKCDVRNKPSSGTAIKLGATYEVRAVQCAARGTPGPSLLPSVSLPGALSADDAVLCCALFCCAAVQGTLRVVNLLWDGHRRDTAVYSWIDTEWTATRALCERLIAGTGTGARDGGLLSGTVAKVAIAVAIPIAIGLAAFLWSSNATSASPSSLVRR
jgi:RimJ/RimL family protein N-acetyltransferase